MLAWLTELRETLKFTTLLKDLIKDADEQPGEEMQRVRPGRVWTARASVPVELGCVPPPGVGVFTSLEALQTPY